MAGLSGSERMLAGFITLQKLKRGARQCEFFFSFFFFPGSTAKGSSVHKTCHLQSYCFYIATSTSATSTFASYMCDMKTY